MDVSSSKNIVSTNTTNDSIITSNDMNNFLDYNNSDHILDKTTYSNYSRLLLVAGIDIHYYYFISITNTITNRIRGNWSSCYIRYG